MNEVVVPAAPHWYKPLVMACAPDNTLVYGAKNDIVIIQETGPGECADFNIIHGAHSKYTVSVSLNKKWKEPNMHAVSAGEDGVIKVWDLQTFDKKTSSKVHLERKDQVVGAVFAGDDRVVSAASNGFVAVWNISTNEVKSLKNLFSLNTVLTTLSSCPHAGWLLAFGLNNGAVVIADLRRDGQVLHKLRGHYQAVVGLTWCPAPVNVFPRRIQSIVRHKEEQKAVKTNPWINLVHSDDDEIQQSEKPELTAGEIKDFLKECDEVKMKILGIEEEVESQKQKQPESDEKCVEPANETTTNVSFDSNTPDYHEAPRNDVDRPIPHLFDPSGDFLDDSIGTTEEQILEALTAPVTVKEEHVQDTSRAGGVKESLEEEPRTEYLLASSGKDGSIYIWRAGTDGRMQTFFSVPKKGKRRDSRHVNQWTSICWIAPNRLLTSSPTGEVLMWPLPRPQESNKQFKNTYNEHSSVVFNLVTPLILWSKNNWQEEREMRLWSWGKDGQLSSYNLTKQKMDFMYTTVSSQIVCVDAAVVDPNRLAFGLKDGHICTWNLSLPHTTIIEMQKHYQKSAQKISCLAWHPVKEMTLGYGTEEGRVGIIDLVSKKSSLFPHYFSHQVYKIQWGPVDGTSDNLGLYVLAEGKLVIYDLENQANEPVHVKLPASLYVYRFAWKPNYDFLIVNGKDGSLVILKRDLEILGTLYFHEKGFNEILWHPDGSESMTPRYDWFAVTTSKGVAVYDLNSLKVKESGDKERLIDKAIVTFEGHMRPPVALAWSPFDGNKIVSTAPDGVAHVWDIQTMSLISSYVDGSLSHNLAVIWSPLDPDLIITADRVVRIWRISRNPPRNDEEFIKNRKRLLTKLAKSENDGADMAKSPVPSKYCIVPPIYSSSSGGAEFQVSNMRKLLAGSWESESLDSLQLLGTKAQVAQLLTDNYNKQKTESVHKSCELIALWKGNIGDEIEEALRENRVSPFMIAVAPMVSHTLWRDACISYARKLAEDSKSDPLEAASYFLASHKVEDAIDVLCQASLFKEALALAKHRLPENSTSITRVLEKWSQYCTRAGNFEVAAMCHICMGQNETAAKLLARRNTKEILEFAVELVDGEGNDSLCDSIRSKLNEINEEKKSEEKEQAKAEDVNEPEVHAKITVTPMVDEPKVDSSSTEVPDGIPAL